MTLSARNRLSGTIEEITLGSVMVHVVVRVGQQCGRERDHSKEC